MNKAVFFLITGIICIGFSLNASAEDVTKTQIIPPPGSETGETASFSSISVFSGTGTSLYGYKDKRYRDEKDQGDYLTAGYKYGGVEYISNVLSGTSIYRPVIGFNINFLYNGTYGSRTLYAVPGYSIPQETFPPDFYNNTSHFVIYPGFFAGFDKRWLGFDAGITLKADAINEKYREQLAPESTPANPVWIQGKGRGFLWTDWRIFVNFNLRIGPEDKAHFLFFFMRHDYDPQYGQLQAKIIFPVNRFFTFASGMYIYKCQGIYLEPTLTLGGISIALKAGSEVNYQSSDIKKVSIRDSLFYAASVSYKW